MKREVVLVRLREEDKELIRKIAKHYDVSEADVVKLLLHEYVKNHKDEV